MCGIFGHVERSVYKSECPHKYPHFFSEKHERLSEFHTEYLRNNRQKEDSPENIHRYAPALFHSTIYEKISKRAKTQEQQNISDIFAVLLHEIFDGTEK